eukprot:15434949-Alexandrium_andersonii.AAC.2
MAPGSFPSAARRRQCEEFAVDATRGARPPAPAAASAPEVELPGPLAEKQAAAVARGAATKKLAAKTKAAPRPLAQAEGRQCEARPCLRPALRHGG